MELNVAQNQMVVFLFNVFSRFHSYTFTKECQIDQLQLVINEVRKLKGQFYIFRNFNKTSHKYIISIRHSMAYVIPDSFK